MSDDKETLNTNQKPAANPVDQAVNKMRETALKEAQAKVDAQAKVCYDADIISHNEREKLHAAIENLEGIKARLKNFAASLKE